MSAPQRCSLANLASGNDNNLADEQARVIEAVFVDDPAGGLLGAQTLYGMGLGDREQTVSRSYAHGLDLNVGKCALHDERLPEPQQPPRAQYEQYAE